MALPGTIYIRALVFSVAYVVSVAVAWLEAAYRYKASHVYIGTVILATKEGQHIVTAYEEAGETYTYAHLYIVGQHAVCYRQTKAEEACIITRRYSYLVVY